MNEHLERLQAMAENDGTWDLSDNDIAAIKYAVEQITQLEETTRPLLEEYRTELYALRKTLNELGPKGADIGDVFHRLGDLWKLPPPSNT